MTQSPFKPIQLEILRQAQLQLNAFLQTLTLTEQEAVGTPQLWEAKDHVAHMTYWLRQLLVLSLQAIVQKAPQPDRKILSNATLCSLSRIALVPGQISSLTLSRCTPNC